MQFLDLILLAKQELLLVIVLKLDFNFTIDLRLIIGYCLMLATDYLQVGLPHFIKEAISFIIHEVLNLFAIPLTNLLLLIKYHFSNLLVTHQA